MGAPYLGGQVQGPPFRDVHQKVDWVERFVQLGTAASKAAQDHELRYARLQFALHLSLGQDAIRCLCGCSGA